MTTIVVNDKVLMTNKVVKKEVIESMAILNRVKELRAAMGINQQELGSLAMS